IKLVVPTPSASGGLITDVETLSKDNSALVDLMDEGVVVVWVPNYPSALVTEPSIIQSEILKAGALIYDIVRNDTLSICSDKKKEASESAGVLTDDVVRDGSLWKGGEKRRDGGEPSKQGDTMTSKKRARVGKGFWQLTQPR
nr:reverse transcriptase domain-containing protein [Tanacetum cinerariifolium]